MEGQQIINWLTQNNVEDSLGISLFIEGIEKEFSDIEWEIPTQGLENVFMLPFRLDNKKIHTYFSFDEEDDGSRLLCYTYSLFDINDDDLIPETLMGVGEIDDVNVAIEIIKKYI